MDINGCQGGGRAVGTELELCLPYMCRYCLLPYMRRVCWHVCARGSMCQHSNRKTVHSDSKRTISSNITCTSETSICLAHLVPSLTCASSPPLPSTLIPHLTPSRTPALFFHLWLFHFHLFISHLHLAFPFVSVAFFTASVVFAGCPLLHPLSSPRPYVTCLFNLIWYLDCASVYSANTAGQCANCVLAWTAHKDSPVTHT